MSTCLLDPPCKACAFGKVIHDDEPKIIRILIRKEDYGCNKGGGHVVETPLGVGLQVEGGVRYLTERGKDIAQEKGYKELVDTIS